MSDVWHMHDVGWGWWVVMTVWTVILFAAIIYGVFWLARGGQGSTQPERSESPDDVLKRRLAAGEISVEEYERIHRTLDGEPPAGHPRPAAEQPPERAVH